MKVGRNAPCPCGSGRKFKRCCLNKSAPEPELSTSLRGAQPVDAPKLEVEPETSETTETVKDTDARSDASDTSRSEADRFPWEEFMNAALGQKLSMAHRLAEEATQLDGEDVFELVDQIVHLARKEDRIPELETLLQELRKRHPNACEEEAGWLLLWEVEHAVVRRDKNLADLFVRLSKRADKVTQSYFARVDQLRYHGASELLLAGLREGWDAIPRNPNIFQFVLIDIAVPMIWILLERLRQRTPAAIADDSRLFGRYEYLAKEFEQPWWKVVTERRNRPDHNFADGEFDLKRAPGALRRTLSNLSIDLRDSLQDVFGC